MDDISEVLIYILFIAVSVIGGIYKNYTKKKEEEERRQRQILDNPQSDFEEQAYTSKPDTPHIPNTIEDFLNKQFDLESESINTQIKEDFIIEKTEGVAAFKETNETLLSDNISDPNFSISSKLKKQSELETVLEEEKTIYDNNSNKDEIIIDLQQAVIYSEILNRPYS